MRKVIIAIIFALIATRSYAEGFIELRIPCTVGEEVTAKMPAGEIVPLGRVKMTVLQQSARLPSMLFTFSLTLRREGDGY